VSEDKKDKKVKKAKKGQNERVFIYGIPYLDLWEMTMIVFTLHIMI